MASSMASSISTWSGVSAATGTRRKKRRLPSFSCWTRTDSAAASGEPIASERVCCYPRRGCCGGDRPTHPRHPWPYLGCQRPSHPCLELRVPQRQPAPREHPSARLGNEISSGQPALPAASGKATQVPLTLRPRPLRRGLTQPIYPKGWLQQWAQQRRAYSWRDGRWQPLQRCRRSQRPQQRCCRLHRRRRRLRRLLLCRHRSGLGLGIGLDLGLDLGICCRHLIS
mmetsp:Transcript_85839/g.246339  ORF Transcript_85839/g.246339 Transcript_85839/m.246339 type:complete len:226 (+) Transcript_85839:755-1432(+)